MELEELKILWGEMSKEVEKQKTLTDKIIIDMTQERYNSRLSKISIPETLGAIICLAIAIFVLVNFNKLDTWYLMVSGIYTIAYLLLIPTYVIKSIDQMKGINIAGNNFKQTLIAFTQAKKQFFFVQKLGIYLGYLLIIAVLPLAGKIMNNKDIFLETNVWFWYMPLMILFLFFFSRWGLKHYSKTTTKAESLLKELDN